MTGPNDTDLPLHYTNIVLELLWGMGPIFDYICIYTMGYVHTITIVHLQIIGYLLLIFCIFWVLNSFYNDKYEYVSISPFE